MKLLEEASLKIRHAYRAFNIMLYVLAVKRALKRWLAVARIVNCIYCFILACSITGKYVFHAWVYCSGYISCYNPSFMCLHILHTFFVRVHKLFSWLAIYILHPTFHPSYHLYKIHIHAHTWDSAICFKRLYILWPP